MSKIKENLNHSDVWYVIGSLVYLVAIAVCIALSFIMGEGTKLYIIVGAVILFSVVFGTLCLCKSADWKEDE